MRKTLMTGLLLLAFSCPAFAGEMLTPPAPQPASAPASATQEPTAEATTEDGTQGTYAQTVLELLAVLPSIL
jgi:hypothetical protein